jgi:hypothetical protein
VDLSTFQVLLTPSGQEILQAATALAPRESEFLIHFQSLSRHYPPDLARAALEIGILRREAIVKFPFASELYLTRQSLEQASSFEVSSHRAERFRQFAYVTDLGCSIGGDTFALAKNTPTIGMDIDHLRLSMASANLNALGLSSSTQLIQSDLSSPLPIGSGSIGLFFDPARRSGDQRYFSVHQYLPPSSIIKDWLQDYPAIEVKISPGVNLDELGEYSAEVEFISLHGELKEAVLWFGPLETASFRATILPGPFQLVTNSRERSLTRSYPITNPCSFLYEPDPAVIRSGLVTTLAAMIDAS